MKLAKDSPRAFQIALFFVVASCSKASKTSMQPLQPSQVRGPAFGRILVSINGKNKTGRCQVHFRTNKYRFVYPLPDDGQVFIQAEDGRVEIEKLQCKGLWGPDSHTFVSRLPVFKVRDPQKLTYFGLIEFDWTRSDSMKLANRIKKLSDLAPNREGPMEAKMKDSFESDWVRFQAAHPAFANQKVLRMVAHFASQ